jgi:hypothetical protein
MYKYKFYKEFEGNRTISNAYDAPIDIVMADDISIAVSKFTKKNKLNNESYDFLSDSEYRLFCDHKKFIGSKDLIYYIKKED